MAAYTTVKNPKVYILILYFTQVMVLMQVDAITGVGSSTRFSLDKIIESAT